MSFSRAQQPEFRLLVAKAWREHCREHGLDCTPKPDRAWYETELQLATGKSSTSDCNAGSDYEAAMSHFEALSGDGIKWQMRQFRGPANRIEHALKKLCADHEIAEDYMQRIARHSLRVEELPELHKLSKEQLLTILRACKQYVTRKLVAEGIRDPQISKKTRKPKPAQVAAASRRCSAEASADQPF